MLDPTALKSGLVRWTVAMHTAAPELNELDGRLGDGDLGATLSKCATNVEAALPDMSENLVGIFKSSAQACAKASGSSFGTLLSVALLGAAKWVDSREQLTSRELAEMLEQIVSTLSTRGGASLGDKTMLDSLEAIARALADAKDGEDLKCVARTAAEQAINDFHGKPNRIGRARMYAEKSMSMDDPGMVAILRMTEAL